MKLWLNNILACPDDKSYPLHVIIFEWNSQLEDFDNILRAYKNNYLINFKDPKHLTRVQLFDQDLLEPEKSQKLASSERVYEENVNLTTDIDANN
ncbi:MAG: hypothetical protein GF364_00790, partial [Candidatus Lokiarchaeota archaeon]|nr:hypothetical protein [Candidatus Lokiarchaeota archaeon]